MIHYLSLQCNESLLLLLLQLLKIVTAHVFGSLYYGSPVWLNELTKAEHWRILNSVHYRAIRLALGDTYNKIPRREVDSQSARFTPHQWMYYSNTKMAIQLTNLGQNGPRISKKIEGIMFCE